MRNQPLKTIQIRTAGKGDWVLKFDPNKGIFLTVNPEGQVVATSKKRENMSVFVRDAKGTFIVC